MSKFYLLLDVEGTKSEATRVKPLFFPYPLKLVDLEG